MKLKTGVFLGCILASNLFASGTVGIDVESLLDDNELQLNLDKYVLKILHKDKQDNANGNDSFLRRFINTSPQLIKNDVEKKEVKNTEPLVISKDIEGDKSKKDDRPIEEPKTEKVKQVNIAYFDYQGSTPCYDVDVKRLFLDSLNYPGNPSASNRRGKFLYKVYDHARDVFANILNSKKEEIIFTSGATESNNVAILGYVRSLPKDSHIITTSIEHASVLNTFKALKEDGYDVTILNVDKDGLVDIEVFKKSISPKTKFVSIMYVNNEIGTIQNIKSLGEICKEKGIVFHTDASQAFGKIHIDVKDLNVDMLSASAQKVYGIPGCGLLYVSESVKSKLKPIMYGGSQQDGIRPGTIPVGLIISFAKASEITYKNINNTNEKLGKIQTKINNAMLALNSELEKVDGKDIIELNGSSKSRILGNLNYSIRGVDAADLVKYMDDEFTFSFGSACESQKDSSHVIVSIDKDLEKSPTNIRIGFGRFTSEKSVEKFIKRLTHTVRYLRKTFPDKGQRACKVQENIEI